MKQEKLEKEVEDLKDATAGLQSKLEEKQNELDKKQGICLKISRICMFDTGLRTEN